MEKKPGWYWDKSRPRHVTHWNGSSWGNTIPLKELGNVPVFNADNNMLMSRSSGVLKQSSATWPQAVLGLVLLAAIGIWLFTSCMPGTDSTNALHSTSADYETAPAVPELSPVTSPRASMATKLVTALSRGGSATAAGYVSPSVGFHYTGVMFALKGCQLTSKWYSAGTSSVLSGEMTCKDGDLVAVDVTFDSNDRVTKVLGQGVKRDFDSTLTTNRTF
ncbi:hypothetical protein ANMWB30_23630 [Arthrobacter sp. MWB30]|nr:hypothetical protein ANMWB30_23630 [Arthrobacter sp. MWB30]